MTPNQRAAALRLADALDSIAAFGPQPTVIEREAAALLRELASEPQVEPVAWWCKHPPETGGGGFMTCHEAAATHYMHKFRTVGNGPVLVRLYAHPPQRKPLTDAESERLYKNIKPSQQQDARSCAAFKRLVRVVESAHGIGEAP